MGALPAAATQALARLKQGPVEVMVDPAGSPTQLFVEGGIEPSFANGLEEARVDVLGLYDLYTSGDSAEFSLNLPEMSLNVLRVLFPSGRRAGTYHGFGRTAGTSMRTYAKRFRIRPWSQRDLQENDATLVQLDFWLCAPKGEAKLSATKTTPWTWTQGFQALPDTSKVDGLLIAQLKCPPRS